MEYHDNDENKSIFENKQEQKGNYNFVHFIYTHNKSQKFQIYLSDEYEEAESLQKIYIKEFQKDNSEYISEVYHFKITPGSLIKEEDQFFKIEVIINVEDGNIYQYYIKFKEDNKDFYDYDFNPEGKDNQLLSYNLKYI